MKIAHIAEGKVADLRHVTESGQHGIEFVIGGGSGGTSRLGAMEVTLDFAETNVAEDDRHSDGRERGGEAGWSEVGKSEVSKIENKGTGQFLAPLCTR